MCGRFTLSAPTDELGSIFEVDEVPRLPPRYNIAPTQTVAAVRVDDGARKLVQLRWGLVPSWARDPGIASKLINARAETLAEKPSFRNAFARRRCLVVADGFYEWQKSGRRKQPFHIRMRDGRPFAFAGLWERWTRSQPAIESCTLVTTEPNALLAPIHDRMPVILRADDYGRWLDPDNHDTRALSTLLRAYPDDEMIARAVGTAVNDPRNDSPACVEPLPGDDLFS